MDCRPSVSVVIPCYNEEINLTKGVLDRVAQFVDDLDYCEEVLVVDDGSEDSSADLVESFTRAHPKFRLLREPHRGKAGAVIAGSLSAMGDYVLLCDMDQATPIDELATLRPHILAGCDVVVGSRAQRREGAPLVRKLMATGFILLRKAILDLGDITDSQCGFKCFRAEVIRQLCLGLRVYRLCEQQVKGPAVTAAFDAELLFLARRLGCQIREVPVLWHHIGTRRVHPVRESWRAIRGLLQIRLNDLQGRYADIRALRARI